MHALAVVLVGICSAWNVAGLVALLRVTHARRLRAPSTACPVSVLKPLCGAEARLEDEGSHWKIL